MAATCWTACVLTDGIPSCASEAAVDQPDASPDSEMNKPCTRYSEFTCNARDILVCQYAWAGALTWQLAATCDPTSTCVFVDSVPFCSVESVEATTTTRGTVSKVSVSIQTTSTATATVSLPTPVTPQHTAENPPSSASDTQCSTHGAFSCLAQTVRVCQYTGFQSLTWQLHNTCDSDSMCEMQNGAPYCVASGGRATATQTAAPPPRPTTNSIAPPPPQPSPTNLPPTPPPNPGNSPKLVAYIDVTRSGNFPTASDFGVPGYSTNPYNILILAFWIDSIGPADFVADWTQLPPATRQEYLDAYHANGKTLLVSAFGGTEAPTTQGIDPMQSATRLAAFCVEYGFDGVDLDYEDTAAMQAGTAEDWLVVYTTTLRELLPSPKYMITHAPQAPYFSSNLSEYPGGGYLAINQRVGSMIDAFFLQFYNQGNNRYDTCETLFYASGGYFSGTSVFEMVANGVPVDKIVVGKPVSPAGAANSGFMNPAELAACIRGAKADGWDAGVMGWQYGLDVGFEWIETLAEAF
ncbi:hypothetical protein HDU98_005621 [Podochytrium sp. JEL0797]|nr:hypothetical protein HDU98_005621 [Podochytrium sp. JEL0797]